LTATSPPAPEAGSEAAVLSVRNLSVEVATPDGPVRVVDRISFDVHAGEVFGVVGESGSGKSITMLAVMGLLPRSRTYVSGEVWFGGENLLTLPEPRLRTVRGGSMAMIFQDPMTSLNPVLRIGTQIAENIELHQPGLSAAEVRERVVELLGLVGVPDPGRRARQYPHEFSGGMRQRVMIAMAIANDPALLIADEPTTALDVTIQAQVMDVLAAARAKTNAAMILITHDLGLVAETADRLAVLYGGRVMETGGIEEVFARRRHPYTVGLMASLPRLQLGADVLYSIPGQPPSMRDRPSGCVFHPRCGLSHGRAPCVETIPPLRTVLPGHAAACHYAEETEDWARGARAATVEATP
jgi:oligopeptide/dipeptide ABC transporter ATP-binding protein